MDNITIRLEQFRNSSFSKIGPYFCQLLLQWTRVHVHQSLTKISTLLAVQHCSPKSHYTEVRFTSFLSGGFTKAELPLEGIFFALNFLSWECVLIKNKTTKYTTVKTDITKVVSVFRFPTFLLIKIPREENWMRFNCSNSALLWQ